jgi:crotonobetainyl-CoA:carnitine CoA-transferase CaiB-like acyl-CoA transferase
MSRLPLQGLRVIELADQQAEWAGKLLADMGADVIKVEPPEGAVTRRIGPFVADVPDPERSLFFWHYNTSKRSVTLNLAGRDGRALWLQLMAQADVLIETTLPGSLDARGIGYGALATVNPRLIMVSVTPWGQDGPYTGYTSGDLIQMAMGGIINSCGYDDHDIPPVRPGENHAYHLASHHAVIGLLAALQGRELTGRGQQIDVAVHDCVAVCTEFAATHWFYAGNLVQRQTGRHAYPTMTAPTFHPTPDARWANYGQTFNEDVWRRFVNWAEQAGFGDLFQQFGDANDRLARGSEVVEAMGAAMAALDAEQVWKLGQSLGLPWGMIRRPEEWLDDPHAEARGFFQTVHQPGYDQPLQHPGPPYAFTEHPGRLAPAPRLGEHNVEVYGALGRSPDELTVLRESGAI